jgi:hypothetical protein
MHRGRGSRSKKYEAYWVGHKRSIVAICSAYLGQSRVCVVQETGCLLNLGTAAPARNVLLSTVGCLQFLYRRNTCSAPDIDDARHSVLHEGVDTVIQTVYHDQLMGRGHDEKAWGVERDRGSRADSYRWRCQSAPQTLQGWKGRAGPGEANGGFGISAFRVPFGLLLTIEAMQTCPSKRALL